MIGPRSTLVLTGALALGAGCGDPKPARQLTPVAVAEADTATPAIDVQTGAPPDAAAADADAIAPPSSLVAALGGLWVVDAGGKPVGALVQRGHSALSVGGAVDLLRDGAVVYSPQFGVFFGVQMSTGKVVHPRLGVADTTCDAPVTAGYYTEGDAISGQGLAFVYNGTWYRIEDYKPLQLVTCGGTVPEGAPGKCAPHNGSCRGFPVKQMAVAPPLQFAAPLQFAWLSK
ncbi:MAG: hypothetical protein FJ100_04780 [Deltaproteobacteria bacterium]|nr:hypothetical protein [Deltaproteobacteria bacterium]